MIFLYPVLISVLCARTLDVGETIDGAGNHVERWREISEH